MCYQIPISKVLYRNYTLIKCNPLFPDVFQQGNRSWIAFGQNVTIVEKPQILSDIEQPKKKIPICKEIIDGFFTEKQLKESRTAELQA